MHKKLILFIEKIYFNLFKINRFQSLKYQMILIIMHYHKLKRLGFLSEFDYDNADTIYIKKDEWEKFPQKIMGNISRNYSKNFSEYSADEISEYILGFLLEERTPYYDFILSENSEYYIEIKMSESGYSYQYNGYKKTEIKLQEKANLFAMFTIAGTTFAWLESKKYIVIGENLGYSILTYLMCFALYFLRKKDWVVQIILVVGIFILLIA